MVQPRPRLWLRQSPGGGRRGRVRAHGNGAPVAPGRPAAGAEARGAHRLERQGPDRDRAARSRHLIRLGVALAVAVAACSPQTPTAAEVRAGAQAGLLTWALTVHAANGDHRFTVEIARTAEQQETGLMFRRSLPPNRGMIFPYDP